MTLEPISIATKGYVCFNGTDYCPDDIAIATKGYVCIADVVVERLNGGDSSRRHKQMLDTSLDALLAREDEEILAVITVMGRKQ